MLKLISHKQIFTEKPDIVPFSFGREVVNQGEFAQLICVVSRGDRPLSLTWSLKGDIISSDPVLTTTMIGHQTSLLSISSVDYQHSGVYTCRAENEAGITSYSAELKVNGNLKDRHWKYFTFRKARHCSILIWKICGQSRRFCPTDMCGLQR